MKIVVILILLPINLYCFAQLDELSIYNKKVQELDSSIYFYKELDVTNYIFGGIRSIAIIVKRKYKGETISFFCDTLKIFYKNGKLKHLTTHDSVGLPKEILQFDKLGKLTQKCLFENNKPRSNIDYKKLQNSLVFNCKKYKNGKLIYEGNYINKKVRNGSHIWYNLDGSIKKKVKYIDGKKTKTFSNY